MWTVICEYICAVLVVAVFVVLPWLMFLSICNQLKAVSILGSVTHASWWLMCIRMTRYVIHDMYQYAIPDTAE